MRDDGDAIPSPGNAYPRSDGMSLRDWFAGQALAGYRSSTFIGDSAAHVAEWAYADADAMLAERAKGKADA